MRRGRVLPIDTILMMKYACLVLALALGLTVTGSAHAQLLDAGVNVNVTGSSSLNDEGVTNDSGNDPVSDLQDNNGADTTVSSDGAGVEVNTSSTLNFRFERRDMDEKTDYAVTESYRVRSSAGLESYAATTVRDNEKVESIELGEGAMRLQYRKDARFLWLIPSTMKTTITVHADGSVEVRYPWYAFLMSTDESTDELAARIQGEIETIASADTGESVTADPEEEVRRWARIMVKV